MNTKSSGTSLSDTALPDQTEGVKTLLGDPRNAIIKLAMPMILAMSAQTIYNVVDALWVSGFGADVFSNVSVPETGPGALAAIGFVLPFFMMIIALSTGLGVGAGSAISRRIGAKDKAGADNVAIHSIIIILVTAVVFSILLFTFADRLFIAIGADVTAGMAISYGRVIFAGSIFIFFSNIAYAILRSEGDAKRAMYAMLFGAGLNIVLDPLFIYTFGLGVTGAAYATILSMGIASGILIFWLFFRKDTFVSFKFRGFKFDRAISKDIFRVGLPASVQQLSMSFTMLFLTIIIVQVAGGGEDGVAIYNTGWRIATIAILPLLGSATAVVSVTGAAFGARAYEKLNAAFMYAIKIGLLIEIVIAGAIFALAPFIVALFTTSPEAGEIRSGLEMFLRITCLFYPGAAFGIASSAMFQGTGKGTYALIATLLRTLILTSFLTVIFAFVFNLDLIGVWWGLVVANLLGSIISFTWATVYIRRLRTRATTPVVG